MDTVHSHSRPAHARGELASLKAIGLTPRQVLGSVINGAVALGILVILIGIPLGLWLNTLVAQALSSSVGGPPNIQVSTNLARHAASHSSNPAGSGAWRVLTCSLGSARSGG